MWTQYSPQPQQRHHRCPTQNDNFQQSFLAFSFKGLSLTSILKCLAILPNCSCEQCSRNSSNGGLKNLPTVNITVRKENYTHLPEYANHKLMPHKWTPLLQKCVWIIKKKNLELFSGWERETGSGGMAQSASSQLLQNNKQEPATEPSRAWQGVVTDDKQVMCYNGFLSN